MRPEIAFFVHAITSGGAERVVVRLANGLASRGWKVQIYTMDDGTVPPFYAIGDGVDWVPLHLNRSSYQKWHSPLMRRVEIFFQQIMRLIQLRDRILQLNPKIMISFIDRTNVVVLLALMGSRIPVVVSERIDSQAHDIGPVWRSLRRLSYLWTDALVVQSTRVADQFSAWVRAPIQVIPNPVPQPPSIEGEERLLRKRRVLLGVGRLVPQKGFDLLIQAFASVAQAFPDWDLEIWGEGCERIRLEDLAESLGYTARVQFCGRTLDIYSRLRQADLFVLSSRFEGFPNALCEAMSVGLPVISFDCPSGPALIIRHGENGLLVGAENVKGLATAMASLMGDDSLRKKFGSSAREVIRRFHPDLILDAWEEVLGQIHQEVRG